MYIVFLYLVGVVAGRLTTILSSTKSRQRDCVNVAVGIIGALFGGLVLTRALAAPGAPTSFSVAAALLAAGAAGSLLISLTWLRKWHERGR